MCIRDSPIDRASWIDKRLGTANRIPPDRSLALEPKHYLEANFHVDKNSDKTTARLKNGVLEVGDKEPEYMEPRTVHDIITALLNMMFVDFQLWPRDPTTKIMFSVALEFDFFGIAATAKQRVELFNLFVKNVLSHNARYFRAPPLDYDGIKKVAEAVLKGARLPYLPVVESRYMDHLSGSQARNNNDSATAGRGGCQPWSGRGGAPVGRGGGNMSDRVGRQSLKGRLPTDNRKLFYKGKPVSLCLLCS